RLLNQVLDVLVVAADVERKARTQPLHDAHVVAVRGLRFQRGISEYDRRVLLLPDPLRYDVLEGRALHERPVVQVEHGIGRDREGDAQPWLQAHVERWA